MCFLKYIVFQMMYPEKNKKNYIYNIFIFMRGAARRTYFNFHKMPHFPNNWAYIIFYIKLKNYLRQK